MIFNAKDLAGLFREHRAAVESGAELYVPTGITGLDDVLGGFKRGGLYTICGRPGMGKTSVGLTIALAAARTRNVLFVSLEQSAAELALWAVAAIGNCSRTPLQRNTELSEAVRAQTCRALEVLSAMHLTLLDDTATTGGIAKAIEDTGAEVAFIDHIGIVTPGEEDKTRSRYEQTTNISRQLKLIARSYNIPVIAMAQLNRANEGRADRRPMLADLRDSGALEQDSDGVVGVYRASYYSADPADPCDPQAVELIIRKNRHGQTGTGLCYWTPASGHIAGGPEWMAPAEIAGVQEEIPF